MPIIWARAWGHYIRPGVAILFQYHLARILQGQGDFPIHWLSRRLGLSCPTLLHQVHQHTKQRLPRLTLPTPLRHSRQAQKLQLIRTAFHKNPLCLHAAEEGVYSQSTVALDPRPGSPPPTLGLADRRVTATGILSQNGKCVNFVRTISCCYCFHLSTRPGYTHATG